VRRRTAKHIKNFVPAVYPTAEQASKALDDLRARLAQLRNPDDVEVEAIPPHMIPSIAYPRITG
jgi:hypothetical protein